MPGTPHPELISTGINDFPDYPNLRRILSIINAILAMYPQSSNNANKKNNNIICGTNPKTAPTPPIIPSFINPCYHGAVPTLSKNTATFSPIISPNKVSFVQSVNIEPNELTAI